MRGRRSWLLLALPAAILTLGSCEDGGISWIPQASGTDRAIPDFFFLDGNRGWFIARHPGTIAATNDGGETWSFQTCPTPSGLNDVGFADASTGWAVGYEGTLLKTVTGGAKVR